MQFSGGARPKIPASSGRRQSHIGRPSKGGRGSLSLGHTDDAIRRNGNPASTEIVEYNYVEHRRSSRVTGHSGPTQGMDRGDSTLSEGERSPAHLGLRRLQEYADESMNEKELVLNLISRKSSFSELLNLKSIDDDSMKFLLKIIAKACKTSVQEYTIEILSQVAQSQFLLQHVSQSFLMTMLRRTDPESQPEFNEATENLLIIVEQIIVVVPSSVSKCEVVLLILKTASEKLEYLTEDERILLQQRVQSLLQRVNDVQSTKTEECLSAKRKEQRRKPWENRYEAFPPPNDFRYMSVYPTPGDIHTHEMPYLRANKNTGEYDDISHYLDVQFRLLREDYVRPLREEIAEYLQRKQDKGKPVAKFNNMQLYRNVRVICPVCTTDGTAYRIKLDTSRLKGVNWQASKRLLYGSLVCLSPDDFQTLLLATVTDRDVKNLSRGFVDIDFVDEFDPDDKTLRQVFKMVETTAYFEAYKHVLSGLQEITDELPFQRYVVSCQPEVRPTQYLLNHPEQQYDLTCFLKENATSGDKNLAKSVPVLNTGQWPSLNSVCFDNSQLLAVKTALTKEFAIIQGPPGTGKTFVGLKIVQALLANKACWSSEKPILIVCYTNHALDQFLEGIVQSGENNLVRVGGRSNSESLKGYTLSERRKGIRKMKIKSQAREGTRDCCQEMRRLQRIIHRASVTLETSAEGILHEKALRDCMTDHQFVSFTQHLGFAPQNKTFMSIWLNFGTDTYEKFQGGFGESKWFALKPEYIEAFLLKLSKRKKQKRWSKMKEMRIQRKDLSVNLKYMRRTLTKSMDYNDRQDAGYYPHTLHKEGRWDIYTRMVSRTIAGLESDLKALRWSIKYMADKFSKRDQRNRKKDLDTNTQQELDTLKHKQSTLVELLSAIPRDGILLTSRLVEFMTPSEVEMLELDEYQRDEYIIARWLGFGWVVNMLQSELKSDTGHDDQVPEEDEFRDSEEDDETNLRKLQLEDITFVHDQQMYRKLMSEIAKENLAVQLESSPQVRGFSDEWQTVKRIEKKGVKKVNQIIYDAEQMNEDEAKTVTNVWHLEPHDRCRLYRYWLSVYRDRLKDSIKRDSLEYNEVAKRLKMLREDEDYHIMKKATVIGITTTGAARFRSILQRVQAPIIVVEEAAEVLEAHIIASLNPSCQHLILIGDHKQLRPSPAVYELAKRFSLDLSLFERMVNNGIQCDTLELQHRMRPEIADLLHFIYPNLKNHDTVLNFEHVKGISSDIFFIDHKEEEEKRVESQSHSNAHEASFISALCRYLLLQGYSPSQITILTAYSGQLFQIKSNMRKKLIEGVKVTTVDNYQGEENDIILLSLVRSNRKGSIGFLGIENRVCVALSRARKGLFVIGNFSLLSDRSQMWSNLVKMLKSKNQCGPEMGLYCQNHPASGRIKVSSSKDFAASPEGGCKRPCSARLQCGHQCEKPCHILDPDHTDYKCQKNCVRKCEAGHPCKKLCHQDCGDCFVIVEKIIPKCGHRQYVYCHIDPDKFVCPEECKYYLPCGHQCTRTCGQSHTRLCQKNCVRKCEAGHPCKKRCHQDCGDCVVMVEKIIPKCGHRQDVYCHMDPNRFLCQAECKYSLPCGHQCARRCGQSHTTDCRVKVRKTWPCGHSNETYCYIDPEYTPCSQPCQTRLDCGHPCSGSCGECLQGRIHKGCSQKCDRTLVCGHKCLQPCSESCPPCIMPCANRCVHDSCKNMCGEACFRCVKPCPWSCKHYKCTKPCSEPCDRPPCNKPCKKRLRCGHSCIGLCGEKCPRLCRFCHKDKVCEIFFGGEDKKNARFILLEDCGHVLEVLGMDRWMASSSVNDSENTVVQLKSCPKCKVAIRKSLRYGALVKKALQDIEVAKQKIRRDPKLIRSETDRLKRKLMLPVYSSDRSVRQHLSHRLVMKCHTQHDLNLTENKMSLLKMTIDLKKTTEKNRSLLSSKDVAEMEKDIQELKTRIVSLTGFVSSQQLDEFKHEILRVNYFLRMKVSHKKLTLDVPPELKTRIEDAITELEKRTRFTPEMAEKMAKLVEILKKKVSLDILQEEEEMPVKAV